MPKQNKKLKDSFDNNFEISFNESQNKTKKENIKFFPVRHHSPACAYHLKKTIEDYKPETILIEGPSDANFLMEYMTDENTTAPFCIYSSYIDKSGEKCRSYYPFLDYSPEFVAIKKSNELKINSFFIDMPFGYIIENSENNINKKLISIYDKDNNKFNVNDYTSRLTKKSGLKSFAEFWESRAWLSKAPAGGTPCRARLRERQARARPDSEESLPWCTFRFGVPFEARSEFAARAVRV